MLGVYYVSSILRDDMLWFAQNAGRACCCIMISLVVCDRLKCFSLIHISIPIFFSNISIFFILRDWIFKIIEARVNFSKTVMRCEYKLGSVE